MGEGAVCVWRDIGGKAAGTCGSEVMSAIHTLWLQHM